MTCSNCSRRDFVRLSLGMSAAAGLTAKFGFPYASAQQKAGKAKACILLWMDGAQSQLDTWDLKPGTDVGGPFKEIATAAPEIRICEHLPNVAKQMDKVSIIRTLHSKDPNHETAQYLLHTGYKRAADIAHPYIGSVIFEELSAGKGDLPGCISLGGDPPAGAGYLDPARAPLTFDTLGQESDDIGNAEQITRERQKMRWQMLKDFEGDWLRRHEDSRVEARRQAYARAWKLLDSSKLKAFDVSQEPEETRKLYGMSTLGNGAIMARRLLQAGVRFVEVQYGGWDTHVDNFTAVKTLLKDLDSAYAGLLTDLSRTGMLSETLVVLMGEFGRTPLVNGQNGRDHWARNWSACLGGGGIAGGRVVGKTDARGMGIAERPVSVGDLYATIFNALGIDPEKKYRPKDGRPMKIVEEGAPVQELLA